MILQLGYSYMTKHHTLEDKITKVPEQDTYDLVVPQQDSGQTPNKIESISEDIQQLQVKVEEINTELSLLVEGTATYQTKFLTKEILLVRIKRWKHQAKGNSSLPLAAYQKYLQILKALKQVEKGFQLALRNHEVITQKDED